MQILDEIDDTDLRYVNNHHQFLQQVARQYGIREDGDTVVFNGKSADRYRAVMMTSGGLMLVLPETELDKRISRYLRVSIQLRDNAATPEVAAKFDDRIDKAKTRIARAKKLQAARAARAAL